MQYHKTGNEIAAEQEDIKAAQKEPRQFEVLYNRYYESIFLFVFKRTGEENLTADLTAQVFLKAMQKLHKYTFQGVPFSAWLYRIAANEVNQFYRTHKRQRLISIERPEVEDLMNEIEEQDINEKEQVLAGAIQGLKPEEADLIQLRFFDQKPFKEIGEIVGITENNAKVKIYRILDKLKKLITTQVATS